MVMSLWFVVCLCVLMSNVIDHNTTNIPKIFQVFMVL